MPGMYRAPRPGSLASFDGLEASKLQGIQDAGGRDEGVRGTRPLVSAGSKYGGYALTKHVRGQGRLKSAAVGWLIMRERCDKGVHGRTPWKRETGRDCPRSAPHAAAQPSMGTAGPQGTPARFA